MRYTAARIAYLTNNGGFPGSTVRTSLVGTGLDAVARVRFTGSGLQARILEPRRDDRIDLTVAVDAHAAPGPQTIVLCRFRDESTEDEWSGVLFYVLPRASYGGWYGIGSHLL
jgi:hypothetical protein